MHIQFAAAPAATATTAALLPADERIGCGWFDSSFELTEGLLVVEDVDLSLFQLWASVHGSRSVH